jgi:hypothetical protein
MSDMKCSKCGNIIVPKQTNKGNRCYNQCYKCKQIICDQCSEMKIVHKSSGTYLTIFCIECS